MDRRIVTALAAVAAGAVAAAGWMAVSPGQLARPTAGAAAPAAQGPVDRRVIWMAAVEHKGGADTAAEPFPTGAPPGPGVKLVPPRDGRWETEVYRWDPGLIVAYLGETVELNIWGVHGREHPASIEGHVPEFVVRRGQLTRLQFRVSRPGLYRIACRAHQPAMTAYLLVLMRP